MRRDPPPRPPWVFGPPAMTRRHLLRHLGGWGCLGLSLPGLLQARAAQAARRDTPTPAPKIRACIVIFYYGGPSHLDTFDLKPDAPAEIRGEFAPIATAVPGLFICEHLPRTARIMDKVAVIRSMHHANHLHDSASIETLTGREPPTGDMELFEPTPQTFPSFGGILSYLWRDRGFDVAHAALPFVFRNVHDVPCQGAGFLGSAFDPFPIHVDPASRTYQAELLQIPENLPPSRRARRRDLLERLEAELGSSDVPEGVVRLRTSFAKAYQLLESEAVRRALDITQEPDAIRQRYGFFDPPASVGEGGGGGNGAELGYAREMRGQNLLMARRLVEAGVPFVNVYDFKQQGQNWDSHFKNFNQHKTFLLPPADQGFSALVEDLDARGLLDSTLIIALGEFGRTPRINGEGGRDHWPDCYSVVLAGGGVKGGYVHGSSDKIAAYPETDPVTPADLAATIFWRFGLDPETEIHDTSGRPFKLSEGTPIRALFADA